MLFPGVVHFYPVAVGVHEPYLFYAVHAVGDGILFAGPVFEHDIVFPEPGGEVVYGGNGKAEVMVLWVLLFCLGALDEVEMGLGADAEPGVFAIVEGFGYGVEADDVHIEIGAGLEVYHVERDVVDAGFGGLGHKGLCGDGECQ